MAATRPDAPPLVEPSWWMRDRINEHLAVTWSITSRVMAW